MDAAVVSTARGVRPGWTPERMEDDMDQIEVKGLRIAYERAGEGQPLVLLHGAFSDSREWRRQLDELSDEFAVVAWDAPGCGRSSDPPETFRLPEYADCLAAFVDALGLGRPHVLGLSFGGGLALELYRRYPTVPITLVLASAYAGWAGSFPAEVVEQRLQRALREADLPPEQVVPRYIPGLFTQSAPAELIEEVVAMMSEFHPAGVRAMAHAFAEADLRDVLPRIDVPTLLLYGDADQRAPLHVAEDLHAKIPKSQLVVIPGVGHSSNVEATERFNTEVRSFLREVES
jgi:pimeloyl-ACP methyl ester carboxylesterase